MSGFTAVAYFLVSLFFSVVIFAFWLRIAMRYLRVSTLNQFSRLVYSITDPFLAPFYKLFKLNLSAGQRYEWIAIAGLIIAEILKVLCLSLVLYHFIVPFAYIGLYVLADLIIQPCNLLFYAILIRVILSYINPGLHHPMADFLRVLTEPLLVLGRKIIPDISGFDFSPFIIMIILKAITLFINASLPMGLL